MGILDADLEGPPSKVRRYAITGVALVILLSLGLWYVMRFTPETHTVRRFMDAVVAGDTQEAYQIWHPTKSFTYGDFLGYWGPHGYYAPVKSYKIVKADAPPSGNRGSSGIIVTVDLSKYSPFPSPDDKVKFAEATELQLWVERSDKSISFPPPD